MNHTLAHLPQELPLAVVANDATREESQPTSGAPFAASHIQSLRPKPPYVAPHLELIDTLGAGSMGEVWSAKHEDLGPVAVKLLDHDLISARPEMAERLRREAEAIWRMDSPHVAVVHERGIAAGGRPYMVMELLVGETLEQRIDRTFENDELLEIDESLWILGEISHGLAAAHAHGIIHRDLKPDNVFLAELPDGLAVKLLDFGIAKRSTVSDMQLTVPGSMLGTPYYMSREQLLSATDVDHRADLWAFAVVAYELLTGSMPFNGDNLGQLVRSVFDGLVTPVGELRAELPPELDAWFEKALHDDVDARFQSVGESWRALQLATQSEDRSGVRRVGAPTEDEPPPPAAASLRALTALPLSSPIARVEVATAPVPEVSDAVDLSLRETALDEPVAQASTVRETAQREIEEQLFTSLSGYEGWVPMGAKIAEISRLDLRDDARRQRDALDEQSLRAELRRADPRPASLWPTTDLRGRVVVGSFGNTRSPTTSAPPRLSPPAYVDDESLIRWKAAGVLVLMALLISAVLAIGLVLISSV